MSTGRSIHAVPSITPSPREGYEICRRILKPDQALALFAGLVLVAQRYRVVSVRAIASNGSTVMAMGIKRQARRASDLLQPAFFCVHSTAVAREPLGH